MSQLLLSLAFLVGLFWVIEHVFGNKRGRPWRRPQMLTDAALYAFDTLITKPINFVFISFVAVLGHTYQLFSIKLNSGCART